MFSDLIGQRLLWSFAGHTPPADFLDHVQQGHVTGATIFRALNVQNPAQVRALTANLQNAAAQAGQPLLLLGADQEGGQLMAIGDGPTPFPGNLTLGAAAAPELAYRVGYAIGQEVRAMGLNLNYAPVCDVNNNPHNPVVGTRSFGEDPAQVAELCAAKTRGMQAAGVAATAKHFPGHGDTATDSHHGTPIVQHSLERLRAIELPPFAAVIAAGVKLMMTAHIALPSLDGELSLPATLSPAVLQGLLRRDLGFEGVIVSDALDMKAITQGVGLLMDAIASAAAGVDILMLTSYLDQPAVYAALAQAVGNGLLPRAAHRATAQRIAALKAWLAAQAPQPELDVIGCAAHHALALEVAQKALTLVRDEQGLLPVRLPAEARVAVILPRPTDLTPADTSSYEMPALATALRQYHAAVDEFIVPFNPSENDIAALRARAADYALILMGTLNATIAPGQAALVNAILATGVPTVPIALRMPYDLQAYPNASTYLCAYSIQAPMMTAIAQALWGDRPCTGRLPVSIPGFYPLGHRFANASEA